MRIRAVYDRAEIDYKRAMSEARIIKEIPEGSCIQCGIKGHYVVEEDGFITTECRECGMIFEEIEVPFDRDEDAEAKDRSLGFIR